MKFENVPNLLIEEIGEGDIFDGANSDGTRSVDVVGPPTFRGRVVFMREGQHGGRLDGTDKVGVSVVKLLYAEDGAATTKFTVSLVDPDGWVYEIFTVANKQKIEWVPTGGLFCPPGWFVKVVTEGVLAAGKHARLCWHLGGGWGHGWMDQFGDFGKPV